MFRSGLAVLALSLFPLGAQMAFGDTLHGFCGTPTVTTCIDNGTVTPTSANPPSFGFWGSPGASGQDFLLVLMAPNNAVTDPSSYSVSISGTNVTNSSVTGSLFSTTAFTSGFLSGYLGLSPDNNNGINAFLPSTQGVDSGATGYFVYKFDFGTETGNSGKADAPPYFTMSNAVPAGSVFLAYELDSSGSISGVTANSGAILEDPTTVPEPASALLVFGGLLCAFGIKKVRKTARG